MLWIALQAWSEDAQPVPELSQALAWQALALTPGLLFSEETTPLVSIGYRGLGDPHRFQFMQVLKDGVPIHADPFGYPEAYYTPPLDVVDRIEFIRGGGGLMYGSQPGGAFNYITYMPRRDKAFGFRTQNIFGTDD
jgi:Fe(3+) dicitrate transport protein